MRDRIWAAVCGAAAVAASGVAAAQTVEPVWTQPPNDDVAEYLLPGFASRLGISGAAELECRVIGDGHPFLCRVLSETVPGLGFGAAARVVTASGELSARRVDGVPVPGLIRTIVRFNSPPMETPGRTWTGPEPTPVALALARQVVDIVPEGIFPSQEEKMDGLDHDRRAIVRPWIEELITQPPERLREMRALQLARLFDEDELRGVLAGDRPETPSDEAFADAYPEPTAEDAAALLELRRRYCSRFECGT